MEKRVELWYTHYIVRNAYKDVDTLKKFLAIFLICALLPVSALANTGFSDVQIMDWHYPYVQAMVSNGLISGYIDGAFVPAGMLTQGEFLTLIARTFYPGVLSYSADGKHWASNAYNAAVTQGIVWADDFLKVDANTLGATIDRKTVCVLFDRVMTYVCHTKPLDTRVYLNQVKDIYSIDEAYRDSVLQAYARGITSGYTDGYFRPDRTLTRAEVCVMLTRAAGLKVVEAPSAPEQSPTAKATWYYKGDNADKRIRIFGTAETNKYENEAAAKVNMVEVCVPVWRLNKTTGVKTASEQFFWIHKALAEDIVKIFTEIYNDPTRFPIYEIGGYNWRSNLNISEHNSGIALDINANENYQIYPDGTIGAGSYWKPYEDPHSIPEDSIVVKTFEKYGFSWGGNSWKSNNDYMHFSYLGR